MHLKTKNSLCTLFRYTYFIQLNIKRRAVYFKVVPWSEESGQRTFFRYSRKAGRFAYFA